MPRSNVFKYRRWNVIALGAYYAGGRKAIMLNDAKDGSLVAKATVNLPDKPLEDDEVFIKNWSENEGMIDYMIQEGFVEEATETVPTGHVEAFKCKLTEKGMGLFQ